MLLLNLYNDNGDSTVPISGDIFDAFLDLCFQNADFFSLSRAVWTDCICMDLENELKPFLEREITTLRWLGYDYTIVPEIDRRNIEVYLYRANTMAKNIIHEYSDDVFLRKYENNTMVQSIQTLEDLCFFKNDKLIVGTVTHEGMLFVIPPTMEFEKSIWKFGEWKNVPSYPLDVSVQIL